RLLNDRLSQAIASSKRSGYYGALMFLDMDNFKQLNDSYGHELGDILLVEVANRLTDCVREIDTIARFGGDEFVIVLYELDVNKDEAKIRATIVAEKVRATLAQPYLLTLHSEEIIEHHCAASIGVNLFIDDEISESDILKWADTAMYQAKEAGRNLIRFYDGKA
ncbi:MAG: GGDEF domain-containing protein, partial [Methylococcales bacterium]